MYKDKGKIEAILRNAPVKEKKCCLCGYDIPEAIEEHQYPLTIERIEDIHPK